MQIVRCRVYGVMETEQGFFNVSVGNLLNPEPQGSGLVKTSVRLLSKAVKEGYTIDRAPG